MIDQLTSVYFISLGCPKNLVDSQVMLGRLESNQYRLVHQANEAEVIIINTCSFIQAAKEESIETILEMADQKLNGKCKVLVVSGCLPQRYSEKLSREIPEIDLMIGTGQYYRVTEFLSEYGNALQKGVLLPKRCYIDQPAFIHTDKDKRVQTGSRFSAYLKLSEGCNRRCAFCIIPKLRGFVRSRTMDSLVIEAKELATSGVKELNLVAQDLTHYGIETHYKNNLVDLLPKLAAIDGIRWIRLHYVYPDEFSDELINVIARENKIVKYLDMPIQHTNDRILYRMNRKLTKKKLFTVVKKLRSLIPEIVFRTSVIVGFPSETQEEFEELCRDLLELNFDHVGIFSYSKEEGTKASKMGQQVHASTKSCRRKELIKLLQIQNQKKMNQKIGKTFSVLIEGLAEETDLLWQGRLSTQAQEVDGRILINDLGVNPVELSVGDIVPIEITEIQQNEMIGRLSVML